MKRSLHIAVGFAALAVLWHLPLIIAPQLGVDLKAKPGDYFTARDLLLIFSFEWFFAAGIVGALIPNKNLRVVLCVTAGTALLGFVSGVFVDIPDIRLFSAIGGATLFAILLGYFPFIMWSQLLKPIKDSPNQAPLPTPVSVTPAAGAPVAPATGAAEL
jgi:hypothetical protein